MSPSEVPRGHSFLLFLLTLCVTANVGHQRVGFLIMKWGYVWEKRSCSLDILLRRDGSRFRWVGSTRRSPHQFIQGMFQTEAFPSFARKDDVLLKNYQKSKCRDVDKVLGGRAWLELCSRRLAHPCSGKGAAGSQGSKGQTVAFGWPACPFFTL